MDEKREKSITGAEAGDTPANQNVSGEDSAADTPSVGQYAPSDDVAADAPGVGRAEEAGDASADEGVSGGPIPAEAGGRPVGQHAPAANGRGKARVTAPIAGRRTRKDGKRAPGGAVRRKKAGSGRKVARRRTSGRAKAKRRMHGAHAALRVAAVVAAVLFVTSAAAVVWASSGQAAPVAGVEVSLNAQPLGIVADQAAVEATFTALKDEYAAQCGLSVQCDDALHFRPVEAPADYFATPEQIGALLRQRCRLQVRAQVILVDGRAAVALRCRDDAYAAMEGVFATYQRDAVCENPRFAEAVTIEEQAVDMADVLDSADATQRLLLGEAAGKENWVQVQQGDTLAGIADTYNLTVQDLYQANPQIAGRSELDGVDRINAIKPMSWLNVLYDVTATAEQVIPYATVEEKSNDMALNKTKVKQQGQDGKSITTTQTTFKNGEPAVSHVLSTTVVQQMVNKVVLVGTQKVETATGSWTLPLKAGTYTLSSRFGTRTLNGVTRMHKGVDLAAATGTKIYASRAGTVAFSGTASGYGLVVYINHAGNAQTRYGHCSKLLVKAGDKVEKGQLIALVGNTGVSTGPHCHFEVRINGTAVNPLTAK
ncbi:MAG: peptidoglycan DD-metalloendopeptidase family protein [Eubacteriales bacterium]|nr:peptidoglycan DD-metalloendopeptidase family protein [Eubacteriales bacterium]